MQSFATSSYRGQLHRLRRLAQSALQQYALPESRLTPLRHESNTTFRVTVADGTRYVLRIHRPEGHTVDAIRSELLWLMALRHDTDLHVPEPVATQDGALLTIAETDGVPEPRVCVLFRWLAGRFLDERLTPAHLERVGAFTAQLHSHTAQWQPPSNFVRGHVDAVTAQARRIARYYPAHAFSSALVHPSDEDVTRTIALVAALCSTRDADVVEHVLGKIRAVLSELGYGKEVFGLIHADLHQENYFFHRGNVRAIDFDDCGWGHYLFDLNVTLRELQHLPNYPALRTAFLRGYRGIRALPSAHESYLDTFFALRRLQLLVWVLESREHPAFRDDWAASAQDDLEQLRRFLAAV